MVNLGDMGPILPLGALFVAGNSSKGRQYTGGEGGKQFIAGGFAGGSAEFVANEALKMAGVDQSSVPDELAQSVLGGLLSRYGDAIPQNKAMARGIHYSVAQQSLQDLGVTAGQLAGGGGGTQSIQTQSAPSPAPAPQNNTGGSGMVSY